MDTAESLIALFLRRELEAEGHLVDGVFEGDRNNYDVEIVVTKRPESSHRLRS